MRILVWRGSLCAWLWWIALRCVSYGGCHGFVTTTNTKRRHANVRPQTPRSTRLCLLRLELDVDDVKQVLGDDDSYIVLSRLQSLIRERAAARWEGQYDAADALKSQIDDTMKQLPSWCQLKLQDVPRAQGGGTQFSIVYELEDESIISKDGGNTENTTQPVSVLNLAHSALGMAVSYSDRGTPLPQDALEELVDRAKTSLRQWDAVQEQVRTGGFRLLSLLNQDRPSIVNQHYTRQNLTEWARVEGGLRGRKAADAAFWFALAGVKDDVLYQLLIKICIKELQRFGDRPSCRAKDILAIANRLAAAGVRENGAFERIVEACLGTKTKENQTSVPTDLLHLHSDSCALMVWKFSTRQRKQRSFLSVAARHYDSHHQVTEATIENVLVDDDDESIDWEVVFDDPSKPLVVDIGCGMGLSLLGLVSCIESMKPLLGSDLSWADCNFVGTDLSRLAIGYANGLAGRWGYKDRLAFFPYAAETLLEKIKTYPGTISLVLVQFPTPFRLVVDSKDGGTSSGNTQLPASAADGFMVTPKLLQQAHAVLTKNSKNSGRLLIQSNCEDVALWMAETASQKARFVPVPAQESMTEPLGLDHDLPQRTISWIQMDGDRATGPSWSAKSLLPRSGWTETEIACTLNKTPIHRMCLEPQ